MKSWLINFVARYPCSISLQYLLKMEQFNTQIACVIVNVHNCVGVEMGSGEGAVVNEKFCYSHNIVFTYLLTYLFTIFYLQVNH